MVRLEVQQCGLGGLREAVPTGWGLLVCEKAQLRVADSVIEYTHQALSVVDWCKATAERCPRAQRQRPLVWQPV